MDAVERGKHIREYRRAQAMTQRQVAAHFNITASAVSEWERGLVTPEWHRIHELDRLLAAGGKVAALFDMGLTPPSVAGGSDFDALAAELRDAIAAIHARLDRLERPAPAPAAEGRGAHRKAPVRK